MLVGAYGMFWRREDVNWSPGSGPNAWSMCGRIGERRPKLRLADFRFALGIYVLFDDHGAYYAGKAGGKGGIGGRLKDHLEDEHGNRWDRFCWFSFDALAARRSTPGVLDVRKRDRFAPGENAQLLREMEGLLVTIMNTRNKNAVNFVNAQRWEQVHHEDVDQYLDRLQ